MFTFPTASPNLPLLTVSADYLDYQLWNLPIHVTGVLSHSLVTTTLLKAVGVSAGPVGTVAAAAGIKWIIKVRCMDRPESPIHRIIKDMTSKGFPDILHDVFVWFEDVTIHTNHLFHVTHH